MPQNPAGPQGPPAVASRDLAASPGVGERPSLPEPYWTDPKRGLRIYHADCRDLLPCFADGEFGSVVTDAPYGVGKGEFDVPPTSEDLAGWLRVASGSVLAFGGSSPDSIETFTRLRPRFQRMLVWAPKFTLTATASDGMFWHWTPVFVWRLPGGKLPIHDDVLEHPTERRRGGHPFLKPSRLMRDLVASFGGTSVLDPYCGSASTLAACARLGVPCTGIEIDEHWCGLAKALLSDDHSYGAPSLFTQPAEVTP